MITARQALDLILKSDPNCRVTQACEFGDYYVFTVIDRGQKIAIDPYYAVDKKDGQIHNYAPGDSLFDLYRAMKERAIKFPEIRPLDEKE